MCTVTYLPIDTASYILTSNRDEAPSRNAVKIELKTESDQSLLFPKDPEKGGTWLALSNYEKIICLLNGAFEPFEKKAFYRKSRGSVVLDYFSFPNAEAFQSGYNFKGIAPFTLVILESGNRFELNWDGINVFFRPFDHTPKIWSSVTLYPENVRKWRKTLFETWLKDGAVTQDKIIHFHQHAGDDDHENGFQMNRNEIVKTLSVSSVFKQNNDLVFKHRDLVNDHIHYQRLKIKSHQTVVS